MASFADLLATFDPGAHMAQIAQIRLANLKTGIAHQ
jgi:hypothetical protein